MAHALPADPMLPHLARALDGAAMHSVFASLLTGPTLLSCDVDRVKYRPQRNCSVSYRLRLIDRDGRRFEQLVGARVCNGGDSLRRYQQALARGALRSAAGPSLSHLSALDMVAFWLPNDAKLAAPALLFDDEKMRRQVLPDVVAALAAGHGSLVNHRTTLVQFVPESRLCARVDLEMQSGTAAVYAKTDLERSGAATLALMQALHDSPARVHGRLRLAPPLLWQADTGLHWQVSVAGRVLQEVHAEVAPHIAAAVAQQLAALHATPVAGLPALGIATLAQQVHDSGALLARAQPAWRTRLQNVVSWLQAGVPGLADEPYVTLHGDLHLNNILVDGPGLVLIDFDSACRGPAVFELGGWIADTLYRCVLQGSDPRRAAPSCRAFLAAYAQGSEQPVVAEALLAWSVVHALVCKRTYRCVVNLKPGRYAAVPALLAMAEAIAQRGSVDAVLAQIPETA